MIYVTQGHELGVGLEIFLKSFLLLNKEEKKQICLVVDQNIFHHYLGLLGFSDKTFQDLSILENQQYGPFPSTNSLLTALSKISKDDILVTLPTSKDQLLLNQTNQAGYTEFFRSYYQNTNIPMSFKGPHKNLLLITDHLALKNIPHTINSSLIVEKLKITLSGFKKYYYSLDEVIFSGINPHAGENGILGDEEKVIHQAMAELSKLEPLYEYHGPYSGDTLHHYNNKTKNQLFVYMYHDQGLAAFKSQYGLIGLNLTFGLPFLRLSVDHGTAFNLYGKNLANLSGMLYLFKEIFEVINVHQRN